MTTVRNRAEAIDAVLKLSRAATRQAALFGLSLGGAAVVVQGHPLHGKSPALFRMLGRFTARLGGGLILTSDLGVSAQDFDFVAMETPFVIGATPGGGGDPSVATAYGVLVGIQAAIRHRLGRVGLAGTTVAVQGLGRVGYALATLLKHEGARLVVADLNDAHVVRAVADLGAEPVSPAAIHRVPADVFAPCAAAGVLNDRTIPDLSAGIIAGAAKGQLDRPDHAEALRRRQVICVPELIVGAGGLINVAAELDGPGYDRSVPLARVAAIGERVAENLARAEAEGITPTARRGQGRRSLDVPPPPLAPRHPHTRLGPRLASWF